MSKPLYSRELEKKLHLESSDNGRSGMLGAPGQAREWSRSDSAQFQCSWAQKSTKVDLTLAEAE